MKRCSSVLLMVALLAPGFVRAAAHTNAFEKEIAAFEASDKTNPPPKGAILFIGSSSIRLWKTLREDFPKRQVINRGFGGSQILDATYFAERIVWPYQPKTIVFYSGDNDLAAGLKAEQLLANAKAFVHKVRERLPQTKIVYVAVKPSPKRWNLAAEQRKANEFVREFCESEKNMAFVDVFTPMLGADGKPRPELFLSDELHMNEKGYRIWTGLIEPRL